MLRWLCIFLLVAFPYEITANAEMVQTDKPYTYEMLQKHLEIVKRKHNDQILIKTIGISPFGRGIFAVKLGKGTKNVLLVGAHHGREWLTSMLLMKMLDIYATSYQSHTKIGSYQPELLNDVSIWFVPMLNPDGVTIQQNKTYLFPAEHQNQLMFMNEGWDHYIRWKANGLGIDLNKQYPAGWAKLKNGPTAPSYQFYKGKAPLEAAEVHAFIQFVNEIQPSIAIAYHTAGREIYWKYKNGENLQRDRIIAAKMANITGYRLAKPPQESTGGGFTDWFITAYHRPAMTFEISYLVGDRHPPLSVFNEEWERNKTIGLAIAEEANKMEE